MQLDSTLMFDEAAAITVTRDSTNILDLNVARDLGVNGAIPLKLLLAASTPFTAAGAATLTVALQGAPDNGSGLPGTWTTYVQSIALSLAQINAAGFIFPITVPRPPSSAVAMPRFLKLVYTVATGPMTAGAVNAGLVISRDDWIAYPKNYDITSVI